LSPLKGNTFVVTFGCDYDICSYNMTFGVAVLKTFAVSVRPVLIGVSLAF